MSKTVDITERTFEQEKESFRLMCKAFEALCTVVLCVFAIIVVLVVAVIAVKGAPLNDVAVLVLNSLMLLLGMSSALNFARAIFKSLRSGETPFRYDIADKVKGASIALVMSGLLGILVQSISHIFSEAFGDICHYFLFIAVGNIFIGVLLGIMSYVMNYGCKLQQESDETL